MRGVVPVLVLCAVAVALYVLLPSARPSVTEDPGGERREGNQSITAERLPGPVVVAERPRAAALGVESCDHYLRRFAACERLPPRTRAVFERSFDVWRLARPRAHLSGSERQWEKTAAASCDRAGKAWLASLEDLGC